MTNTERIKRLAHWMGFKPDPLIPDDNWFTTDGVEFFYWNPIICIQDAWMLEDEIENRGLTNPYMKALMWISGHATSKSDLTLLGLWKVIHSTPKQRCQAIEKLMKENP